MRTDLFGKMKNVLASGTLAALAILPLAAAQGQTPRYSVTNLGTLVSSSENDTVAAMSLDGSKIVGSAQYRSGNSSGTNAFYWDGTMHTLVVMQPLGAAGGTPGTTPVSVTSTGLVLLGISPASVWTLAGGKVALNSPGGLQTAAYAMNDAGVIAGMSDNPAGPLGNIGGSPAYTKIGLRWARVGGQWTYTQLPPLAGHNSSRAGFGANSIDPNGNMIGTSYNLSVSSTGSLVTTDTHYVLWSPLDSIPYSVAHDLGAGVSQPIDSRTDSTTGMTQLVWNSGSRAFYSYPTTGSTTELMGFGATTPSAAAKGVNTMGQVAGVASFASGSHAFYWDTTFPSGVVMDLGVLPGMTGSALYPSGFPINILDDFGYIVGASSGSTQFPSSRAFLSTAASRGTASKLLDLNTLLTPNALSNAGLAALTQGRIINNAGFIAAHGVVTNGWQRAVRLTRVQ